MLTLPVLTGKKQESQKLDSMVNDYVLNVEVDYNSLNQPCSTLKKNLKKPASQEWARRQDTLAPAGRPGAHAALNRTNANLINATSGRQRQPAGPSTKIGAVHDPIGQPCMALGCGTWLVSAMAGASTVCDGCDARSGMNEHLSESLYILPAPETLSL